MSSLDETLKDKALNYSKAGIGILPGGGVIAEILFSFVPDQRQDRVIAFIKQLSDRVSAVEEVILKDNPLASDILQDAVTQSARALSEERNSYLASVVLTQVDCDESVYNVKKNMLYTLSELTDLEIQYLHKRTNHIALRKGNSFEKQALSRGKYNALSESERQEYDLKSVAESATIAKLLKLNLLERKDNLEELLSMPDANRRYTEPRLKRDVKVTNFAMKLLEMIGLKAKRTLR